MRNISEKLKSKWVLIIISILLLFLIKDIIQIFEIPYVNNSIHGKHVAFKLGFMTHLLYEPFLRLFLIYIILFKIDFAAPEQ